MEATKNETEVDLPGHDDETDNNFQGAAAAQSNDNSENNARSASTIEAMATAMFPLNMKLSDRENKFSVENGIVKGLLFEADQEGTFKSRLILSNKYGVDTVKKEFG